MRHRDRHFVSALTGFSFLVLSAQGPLYQARVPAAAEDAYTEAREDNAYQVSGKDGDTLPGEWRVKCGVKIYRNGNVFRSAEDDSDSLVIAESDPDGSYRIHRFPVGFGEGFARLRRVGANQYSGDDTVRGITTSVKQTIDIDGERITIRQLVIDAPTKDPHSDLTCTGTRLHSTLRSPVTNASPEVCDTGSRSSRLPKPRVAGRYKFVKPFADGLAAAAVVPRGSRNPKWGFIDTAGRVVIPMRYDVVTSLNGGLAAAGRFYGRGRHVKWGVIEKLGPQVTPHLNYDAVKILGEGFAAVGYAVPGRPGLRWNLINRENTIVFHGLDRIECFARGRALASYAVGDAVHTGYIDKVGNFISARQ
ncbi:MAG: WG repeat-containing protein [Blastocatellia bacterium]